MKQGDLGLDVKQLTERQEWLQSSAHALMDEVGLRAILETAGRVWPGGSFDLGLMVWPDLDIEVITTSPPQPAVVVNVLQELVLTTGIRKINYADHRAPTDSGLPTGVYLGPDVEFRSVAWQVDLWFIDADQARERRRLHDRIRDGLDEANRRSILQIKQVAAASDGYHRGVSSVDIYEAVWTTASAR
ncbi:hypothetical protein [Microlunatus soli]|uniref:GrpB family protein n=1 Tax=Microlunatus soli TaxID=630515 RepID=A0A1H2A9A5_9ACTN|nr:hypothetical protein [Microlunatus soli]SDT42538.1 hypothetical protein SAMN04489812_5765 [Microlunatus soli]